MEEQKQEQVTGWWLVDIEKSWFVIIFHLKLNESNGEGGGEGFGNI